MEEARRKEFNGTVQGAGHQTITVIPAANGLQSLFQTCQLVGPPGLLLTQAPITLAVAQQPPAADAPAEPKRQASPPGGAPGPGADPLGAKPKKSKEQLAELKASYGRRQFATEAEIARLMRVTGLTKRAIKKWFSDTRYNQRNAKEHQGAVPGEAPPPDGPPDQNPELEEEEGGAAEDPDANNAAQGRCVCVSMCVCVCVCLHALKKGGCEELGGVPGAISP